MFSSMTMASSTTKPTAIVMPMSDRLSSENPSRYIMPNVPTKASGTVTLGMMVAQRLRRNRKITSTTRAIDSIKGELHVVDTDARMVWVRSTIVCEHGWSAEYRLPGLGKAPALTRSTVAMTLAPGCL